MKRIALFSLTVFLIAGSFLPTQAQMSSNRAQDREVIKANKRQEKAQRKYAKAQKKAERKMLKTERKNTKYPTHSLGR